MCILTAFSRQLYKQIFFNSFRGLILTRCHESEVMDWSLWIFCGVVLLMGGNSGLTIDECSLGSKDIAEDTDMSFTCGTFWRNDELTWDVYNADNNEVFSSSCSYAGCTPRQNKFSLQVKGSRAWGYSSVLTIQAVNRYSVRRIRCETPSQTEENCSLRITAYPSYTEGSCNVRLVDWSVFGGCTVEGMYSSDNSYTCSWRLNNNDQNFGGFGGTLQTYTKINNRSYTRGNCSFMLSMPVIERVYTFNMEVSPGPSVYYEDTIYIAYPGDLIHDCPNQVMEGSNISCNCTAEDSGNPPARITWDGRQNETLQLTNIRRQSQGVQFSCRLIWGPDGYMNKTTVYTLRVAYGPLSAFVNKTVETSANKSEIVRLTCTAIDVYPSATFEWNVSCHNQTDNVNTSTCFINSSLTADNLVVTCTAYNKHFASVSSSFTYVLQIAESHEAHSSAVSERVKGGLIGGVIAGVVGIIIVAVVIVYIIKRRKGTIWKEIGASPFLHGACKLFQSNSAPSKPDPFVHKPKDQPPIQRHAAPSGDLYTIAGTTTTAGQDGDDYASVCQMAENDVYEPEGDVRLQASPAGHEMNRSGDKETPTVKPKPAKITMTSSFSVSGTAYMNVTEFPTDSGLGVYHIVPWAAPSERTPFACDTSAPGNSEDEYNVLKFDDQSVHDDPGDSYNHLQLT